MTKKRLNNNDNRWPAGATPGPTSWCRPWEFLTFRLRGSTPWRRPCSSRGFTALKRTKDTSGSYFIKLFFQCHWKPFLQLLTICCLYYKNIMIINDASGVIESKIWSILLIVTDDSIKTSIVQVSLKIVTYNCQNSFMVQATGVNI